MELNSQDAQLLFHYHNFHCIVFIDAVTCEVHYMLIILIVILTGVDLCSVSSWKPPVSFSSEPGHVAVLQAPAERLWAPVSGVLTGNCT